LFFLEKLPKKNNGALPLSFFLFYCFTVL